MTRRYYKAKNAKGDTCVRSSTKRLTHAFIMNGYGAWTDDVRRFQTPKNQHVYDQCIATAVEITKAEFTELQETCESTQLRRARAMDRAERRAEDY